MATAKQRAAKRPNKKVTKNPKPAVHAAVTTTKRAPSKTIVPQEKPAAVAESSRRLPSAWTIGRQALEVIWSRKILFGGIFLIYLVISIVVVRAFSSTANLSSLKDVLGGNFSGSLAGLWTGLTVFTVLLTTSGSNASGLSATYQALLIMIISLAIIWALRQSMAEEAAVKIRIRDAFYKGMYPLIPVFCVLLVVLLQLLPFIFAGYIYGLVTSGGIAVHVIERILWLVVLIAGVAVTGYLLTSSLIGLYVATLPDMTPLKALRSARQLVKGRRWAVIRKLLTLPLGLFIAAAIVMVPIILVVPGIAPQVLVVLSMIGLFLVHGYMYTLYRELLK